MIAGSNSTRAHTVTLTATLSRDAEMPLIITAPTAGRVAEIFVRVGARVDRDEAILRLTDPEALSEHAGEFITAPLAGLVLDLLPAGTAVEPKTTLFRMLSNATVEVVLHTHHGPIARDSIVGCTIRCGATPWSATVSRLDKRPDGSRLHLSVLDPDGRLPLGGSVEVELSIAPTAAMREAVFAARRAAWPYSLPPRGRPQLIHLGLADPPPQPQPSASRAETPYDPTRLFAPRRPEREPAPFKPAISIRQPSAPSHRYTLALSPDAWQTLRPAISPARRGRVSDHVDVVARLEHSLANPQPFAITAPVAGIARPITKLCPGEMITPGQALFALTVRAEMLSAQHAYLQALDTNDDCETQRHRERLSFLGLDTAHRNTLRRRRKPFVEIALVAPLAGLVAESSLTNEKVVEAGTTLLALTPANTTFAVIDIDATAFAQLPPQVGVRWVGTAAPHFSTDLPLLEVQHFVCPDGRGRVRLRLPLPAALAANSPVNPLLRLDDPATRRDAVLVPADCIVSLAASSEVLLHTGPGHLRAISVACGLSADGFVEILDGVQVDEPLVRDVALLQNEDRRLRALLAGFWNPAPPARPYLPRQAGNPLL
ncbi:efflux RND transporter periplasmic adaptor subunit [Methylobacterium oxalidis]|uniref:Uncharacterized protein n=1 Tax=Methylobacterium oxalidis TaxID=944322 RepID=A0A512J854_9HYPH|nr:efflux RND transporter periplasmic adaptor subunit [Methylobacterium oxalidis]GEP06147.1 hypothetical protein MOX02_41850 [Methylobacterium oxalidis]GJE34589.1 hypothetical protein LDDCCGHA_4801 [Methylobacterium oxalidis]GLS65166.1 hypothetical protein GCM10007888_35480 [Methylobacterium oxalidis]